VALYEATGDAKAAPSKGRPVVILTMTGAPSGNIRKTPIMRIERDGTYLASPPPPAHRTTPPGTAT